MIFKKGNRFRTYNVPVLNTQVMYHASDTAPVTESVTYILSIVFNF